MTTSHRIYKVQKMKNGRIISAPTINLERFNNEYAGFFSLYITDDNSVELNMLGVLPEYRHNGIGKEIIDFSKIYANNHNCNKIKISIVEENTKLRKWYEPLGFVHTETKTFPSLPFTVGYMELILKSS